MRQTKKIIFSTALILGALCGCTSSPDFDIVSDELDCGGDYFSVTIAQSGSDCIEDIFRNFELGIAQSRNDNATKKVINTVLSGAEFSFRALGSNEISAYGASSMRNGKNLFRNRIAILTYPQPEGLLWQILKSASAGEFSNFASLPANAMIAMQIDLDLTPTTQKTPVSLLTLDFFIPDFFKEIFNSQNFSDAEFVQNISGTWQVAIFDGNHLLLSVPDRNGKLFEYMLKKFSLNSELEMSNNEAGVTVNNGRLSLLPRSGSLQILFGGEETKKLVENSAKLADDPAFCNSTAEFPKSSIGFFHFKNFADFCRLNAFGIDTYLSSSSGNSKDIFLTAKDDLFVLTEIGNDSLPAQKIILGAAITAKLATAFESEFNSMMSEKTNSAEELSTAADPVVQQKKATSPDAGSLEICRKNLMQIFPFFAEYRKKSGTFPATIGNDGLVELLNATDMGSLPDCPGVIENETQNHISYIYPGDWGEFADDSMPLLIDNAANHFDRSTDKYYFNVLFCDGSCQSFVATQPSLRQQISVLQTAKHYDGDRFSEMMRRVDILENQLKTTEISEK